MCHVKIRSIIWVQDTPIKRRHSTCTVVSEGQGISGSPRQCSAKFPIVDDINISIFSPVHTPHSQAGIQKSSYTIFRLDINIQEIVETLPPKITTWEVVHSQENHTLPVINYDCGD